MAVVYDPHLVERLRERQIPEEWPREIIEQAAEHFEDTMTRVFIAITRKRFKGQLREIAVSYKKQGDDVLAITIHPLQQNQKQNRIESGRWSRQ